MLQKVRKSLAVLLVLAMCLGFSVQAMAAGPTTRDGAAETDQAAITKILQVPYGTTVPEITFTFTVTPIDKDGVAFTPATSPAFPNVPVIGDTKLQNSSGQDTAGTFTTVFGASGTQALVPIPNPNAGNTGEPASITVNPDANGNTNWFIETNPFFDPTVVEWDNYGAGIYRYEIRENNPNFTANTPGNAPNNYVDYLTEDHTVYTMLVYVDRNAEGHCVIKNIGVVIIEPGDPVTSADDKLDPTPGGDGETFFTSQMIYTNKYWKRIIVNPADGGILYVSKETKGAQSDPKLYFDFTMTLTKPNNVPDTPVQTTRAYIYELDTSVTPNVYKTVSSATMASATGNKLSVDGIDTYGPYHTVTYGTQFSFALQSNQRLVFAEAFAGSTYTVTDAAVPAYYPNVTVNYNNLNSGGWPKQSNIPATQKNRALTIPSQDLLGIGGMQGGSNGKLFVGETAPNSAAFVNDRGEPNVIGVDINNMPFVGLIALAIAGIAGYVVMTGRKKSRHSA